ncbi:MAG: hypothetical protein WC140_03455 [Bacteroidales bacterium]
MKKFNFSLLLIIISGLVLSISSCTSKTEKAETICKEFLTAYFTADYTTAMTYCTPEMASQINKATENYQDLEQRIKDDLIKANKNIDKKIISSKVIDDSKIQVIYTLKYPGKKATKNGMTLIKIDGKLLISNF